MRRMLRRLGACLAAVMLAVMTAGGAAAEDTVVSVWRLNSRQQALLNALYGPLMACQEEIALPEDTPYDDVQPVMEALTTNYPELLHVDTKYTVTYYQNAPEIAVAVRPRYRMDADTAQVMRDRMNEAALALAMQCSSAEEAHDALLARVTYGGDGEMKHTAYGALVQGYATCEGYAKALTLLYRLGGVPCGVVTGMATRSDGLTERHAWVVASLGGWTLIDPTWNDQEGAGVNTHWYYGLSTEQLGRSHRPDAHLSVPACTDGANWHRWHGAVMTEEADFYRAMQLLVTAGTPVNLRIPDRGLYASVKEDPGAWLDRYNSLYPEDAFYGSYTWMSDDSQQCLILMRSE